MNEHDDEEPLVAPPPNPTLRKPPSLPNELIQHIVQLCVPRVQTGDLGLRYYYLKELCRVSRLFRSFAQPLLFQHMANISLPYESAQIFWNSLSDCGGWTRGQVRSLQLDRCAKNGTDLHVDSQFMVAIVNLCVNLTELCLTSFRVDLKAILPPASKVKALHLRRTTFHQDSGRMEWCTNSLEFLHVFHAYIKTPSDLPISLFSNLKGLALHSITRAIERLETEPVLPPALQILDVDCGESDTPDAKRLVRSYLAPNVMALRVHLLDLESFTDRLENLVYLEITGYLSLEMLSVHFIPSVLPKLNNLKALKITYLEEGNQYSDELEELRKVCQGKDILFEVKLAMDGDMTTLWGTSIVNNEPPLVIVSPERYTLDFQD